MKTIVSSRMMLWAALIVTAGCYYPHAAGYFPQPERAAAKSTGGTDNVNDAAYDAVFFKNHGVNPFVDADDDNLSTFAVDVDTGSYTVARRYIKDGHVPPADAVRVEEFVNYFDYGYRPPNSGAVSIHIEAGPSPFEPTRKLLRIGVKGQEIEPDERKRAILTFVIDISGSMGMENRLGLVKRSLTLLVNQLREGDKVGIVTYGSRASIELEHTGVERRRRILEAINDIETGGATNAEEGLVKGFEVAGKSFDPSAINRVILCSDGVANMGRTGPDSILEKVGAQARKGIFLSTVGFGMGNYNDHLMEALGDKGNGHYAYVDDIAEAKRIFVANLTGTLQVVARDVKVQVEFDKDVVRSYRLIGYENRDVADEDFRDDLKDGGEIGSGHSVTALYEVKTWEGKEGRLATVRVRYQDPQGGNAREIEANVDSADIASDQSKLTASYRLACSVALFAEVLRKSYWAKAITLQDLVPVARKVASEHAGVADVQEFARLVAMAAGAASEE